MGIATKTFQTAMPTSRRTAMRTARASYMLDPDGKSVLRDFDGNLLHLPPRAVNAKQRRATTNAAESETCDARAHRCERITDDALWHHERAMYVDDDLVSATP